MAGIQSKLLKCSHSILRPLFSKSISTVAIKQNALIQSSLLNGRMNTRTGRLMSTRSSGYAHGRLTLLARDIIGLGFIGGATLGLMGFMKPVTASVTNEENSISARFNFIADVVEKTAPAVVYIEIQQRNRVMNRMVAVSNGSGFIVRSDGLILTNAHVVGKNSVVECRLHDGRKMRGFVQAVDPISDLATVKVEATDLPTLRLGNSGRLRPGEWVIALGSPLQLSNTVTAGIVSSAQRGSRELGLHNTDINYIQTDATINFGNSGGPLVNLDGEAIGINTMMVTSGISFAIPSDYAKTFLEKASAIEQRSSQKRSWFGTTSQISPTMVQRGFIGVTMLSLTPDIIRALKSRHPDLPDIDHGVFIHKVVVGSPADVAGIRQGDIIVAINDSDVREAFDVYKATEKTETLKVTIKRDSQTVYINVKPEKANS